MIDLTGVAQRDLLRRFFGLSDFAGGGVFTSLRRASSNDSGQSEMGLALGISPLGRESAR